jgi:uncharacterized protein YfaS (alpha-2-macroglobulin family)
VADNVKINGDHKEAGKEVRVKMGGRRLIKFPISCVAPGIAKFQISCVSGGFGDAQEITFPIYPPPSATTLSFQETLDPAESSIATHLLTLPPDCLPNYGALKINLCTSKMQDLSDAVRYVNFYPYGCTEQISSAVIPLVSLYDSIEFFRITDIPDKKTVQKRVTN